MKKFLQRLSFISMLHFKGLVALGIFFVVEALLLWAALYICTEWLDIRKVFIKILLSYIVATPPSVLVLKTILKAWTGEKMD